VPASVFGMDLDDVVLWIPKEQRAMASIATTSQDPDRARLPVVDALFVGAQGLLGVGRHDDARHGIVAVDAVALDQLAQYRGSLLGGVDQPLAGGGAVAGDDLVGIVLG
jgi:hypothetical protein